MTEQTPNNPTSLPDDLPAGAMLRAAADGEMTADAIAGLKDQDARVTFEQALRESVKRSLSGPETAAPKQLHDSIRAMLSEAPDTAATTDHPVIQSPMGDTRQRSFWSRISGVAAVAAVLLLCATVVIFAVRQSQSNSSAAGAATLRVGTLTSYVHQEHDNCSLDASYLDNKLLVIDPSLAPELAQKRLGAVPSMLEAGFPGLEDSGFTFAGLGHCQVPGKGASVHIVFREIAGDSQLVSLFIQVDQGDWTITDSHCAIVTEDLPDGSTMTAWRDEGFIFLLYTTSNAHLSNVRNGLGIPTKRCGLRPVR